MELPRRRSTLLAAALLAAGCVELLPKSRSEVQSPWDNFEQARAAFETIVPDRTTAAGWSFNGIILIVDERVVYTLYGGQPKLHTEETSRQPLGPFQDMDAVGKLVH